MSTLKQASQLEKTNFDFDDSRRARELSTLLEERMPDRDVRVVHVCGTHEMTITENGLRTLFPARLDVREGPGCPVCVTPTQHLDAALKLAERDVIVTAFGDMMRVPGTERTLEEAKSKGADVRLVYSIGDAVDIAKDTSKEVTFLGVGFETTAPMTAAVLKRDPPSNFSILPGNKLIPPAMKALLELPDVQVDGFIAPGHVSSIIGVKPYRSLAEEYQVPIVIAGFEPLDMLYALNLLLDQLQKGEAKVDNAYPRAVQEEGNKRSLEMLEEVFTVEDTQWRGIGTIPDSGLVLREPYRKWDGIAKFQLEAQPQEDIVPGCRCPDVLTARATPEECELFGEDCTPSNPVGPCMVGEEAMCNIWFRYGGRPQL